MQAIILQATGSGWSSMIFMVAIIGIFYFFMIRPRQKKAKDQKKFVDTMLFSLTKTVWLKNKEKLNEKICSDC